MTRHEMYADFFNMPIEIYDFLVDIFDLIEVRGNVGNENGIQFLVRTNEMNHSVPHVHAKCGGHEISIAIETAIVLAGNLPKKQEKKAKEWVSLNREKLLTDWNNIALSAIMPFQKSNLAFGIKR